MTAYLIDTQHLIWAGLEPERISRRVAAVLEDASSSFWISTVSPWELAIKVSIGRLNLKAPVMQFVEVLASDLQATFLPVELRHINVYKDLPLHHRDPFDRMLIAQAMADDLAIVTTDGSFAPYGVPTLS